MYIYICVCIPESHTHTRAREMRSVCVCVWWFQPMIACISENTPKWNVYTYYTYIYIYSQANLYIHMLLLRRRNCFLPLSPPAKCKLYLYRVYIVPRMLGWYIYIHTQLVLASSRVVRARKTTPKPNRPGPGHSNDKAIYTVVSARRVHICAAPTCHHPFLCATINTNSQTTASRPGALSAMLRAFSARWVWWGALRCDSVCGFPWRRASHPRKTRFSSYTYTHAHAHHI